MWPWCGGASSAVRSRDPRPGINRSGSGSRTPGRCGRQDAWSLGRLTISLDEQIRKARNKSKKKTTSRTEKRRELAGGR